MSDQSHSTCESCGATIFSESIDTGVARYEDGKLMCKVCVEAYETKREVQGSKSGYALAPIEFEGGDASMEAPEASGSSIAFTAATLGAASGRDEKKYQRPLNPESSVATRCRTFHCKLNDAAAEYLNNVINEWADADPQITIKFATSTIGVFEGKTKDQNLIVTVFY